MFSDTNVAIWVVSNITKREACIYMGSCPAYRKGQKLNREICNPCCNGTCYNEVVLTDVAITNISRRATLALV